MKHINWLVILLFQLIVLTGCMSKQKVNYPFYYPINDRYAFVFLKKDKEGFGIDDFNKYYEARILDKNKIKKIDGYNTYYSGGDIHLSDNKKYFLVDAINIYYIPKSETETDSTYFENYHCTIIDIEKAKVVWRGTTECAGEWKNNQWISDEQVEFDGSN